MSKSKNPAPASTGKKEATDEKSIFAHLQESAKNRWKSIPKAVRMIIVAVCVAALYASQKESAAQLAMLYLIADNGKKSGRADGNVYMRNGVVRGFKVPALVQNTATQTQRSSLSSLSAAFKSLTQAQISAWNAATGFFASDRFGRQIAITGKTLFVRLNQNLFNAGQGMISDVPLAGDVPGITSLTTTAAAGAGTVSLAFAPTPTDANVTHLVFATGGLSAGVSRPSKSAYRLISIIGGATATPSAEGAAYVAKFGAMTAGQKIFIKVIPVNDTTGQAGAAMVSSDIVAA